MYVDVVTKTTMVMVMKTDGGMFACLLFPAEMFGRRVPVKVKGHETKR